MPNGLLLATIRCNFAGNNTSSNGHIFDETGQFLRQHLLGDGIADLQTTKSGDVWVSYFDEGVYGNLGWNQPIDYSGLLRFNSFGEIVYRFQPTDGLEEISDCYSLNVTTDHETWLYYYDQFSIVRLVDDKLVQHWPAPVAGSSNMAILGKTILMQGGYRTDNWLLLELEDKQARIKTADITFQTPDGHVLKAKSARTRQSTVWFVHDNQIFHYDMRSAR